MALLRRKAILAGVLGGQRKWLVWGGFAWVFHWLGRIFGGGEPKARYTQEVSAGERVFVIHEPLSAVGVKKAAKKSAKQARKATKAAAKSSR
jgi:hypothetical protein